MRYSRAGNTRYYATSLMLGLMYKYIIAENGMKADSLSCCEKKCIEGENIICTGMVTIRVWICPILSQSLQSSIIYPFLLWYGTIPYYTSLEIMNSHVTMLSPRGHQENTNGDYPTRTPCT
jgi:hypothetical protein